MRPMPPSSSSSTRNNNPVLSEARHGAVLRLTLCDPARRNPLSAAVLASLAAALEAAHADAEAAVIIIAAEGPVFSAGHDLKEITAHRADADGGRAFYAGLMAACSRVMTLIAEGPKPVIAEVQGMASAAGCQLVASADLAIASSAAQFCTPGTGIGLFCSTPMVALSRAVARKHAMEMLLTADPIPAEEAARIGLINRVVPPQDLTAAVMDLAARIAARSRAAIGFGKPLYDAQLARPLAEAYGLAGAVMTDNLADADAIEGIAAFLGKRAPRWNGKD